jgi:small subunit ribosomal protein S16
MLKIRLQRYGRTNAPSFRVVVLESARGPKAGTHVDQIGFYSPMTKEQSLDAEKAKYWISKGAQPSDTVYNMLVSAGAIAGKKRNALPKKTPIVKEAPAQEASVVPAISEAPAEVLAEAAAPASETPTASESPLEPLADVPAAEEKPTE